MGFLDFLRNKKTDDNTPLLDKLREDIRKEINEKGNVDNIKEIDNIIVNTLRKYEDEIIEYIYEKEEVGLEDILIDIKKEYSNIYLKPTNRIELCKEIDNFIEESPEVSNAVKLYASYMLYGSGELKLETYKVKIITTDEELQRKSYEIIKEFEHRSKIKQKLYMICQELFKYGDAFMEKVYDDKERLINVYRIPSRDCIPVVDNRTEEIKTLYQVVDKNVRIADLEDTNTINEYIRDKKIVEFERKEFIHFSDATPVGVSDSPLRSLSITWKILKLLEEALVIHRITRAKRLIVFLLDVSNKKPSQIRKYIYRFKSALQNIFTVNLEAGLLYKSKSTLHYGTDIIIPIKKDSATKVQTIPADTSVSKIEDLQYYYNRILDGLLISHIFGSKKTGKEEQIENAFYRFIRTYQAQLSYTLRDLYLEVLSTHGIDTSKIDIAIIFPSPDVKEELKLIDTILRRVMVINQLIAVIGVIPPKEWIVNYVFKDLTQEEIKELINLLNKEEEKYSETNPTESIFSEDLLSQNSDNNKENNTNIFKQFIKDLSDKSINNINEKYLSEFIDLYSKYLNLYKSRK